MRRAIGVLTLAAAVLAPAAARASGAWQTFLRPAAFGGLLAEADTVWCASLDAGLLQFTPSQSRFVSFVREPNGLASNHLSSITLDRSRRLWLGTQGAGANVLSPNRGAWSLVNAFDGLPSDSVNTLTADGDTVWIGTTRGLVLWDGHQVSGVLPDGINPSPFASDNITGIVVHDDSLWVATGAGVYVSLESQGLATWTPANTGLPVLAIDRMVTDGTTLFVLAALKAYRWDAASAQWVLVGGLGAVRSLSASRGSVFASSDAAIYRWGGTGWTSLNAALPSSSDSPFVVTLDETGRAWAAGRPATVRDARGTGLYGQPSGGGTGAWSFDLPPGPTDNNCLNIDLEGDRVYVSTFGHGIGRLQGERWTYWYSSTIGDTSSTHFWMPAYPYAMLIDKESHKWFFCWAPYHPFGANCVPDTGVIDILDDPGGVDHVRHHVLGPAPDSARWTYGRASTADSSNGRWFGLDSPCGDQPNLNPAGLLYYSSVTDGGVNYSAAKGNANLPSDLVLSLATDDQKRVWVGTGRGLCYIDSLASDLVRVKVVSNTELYAVRALAVHGNTLWLYYSGGLIQYGISGGINPRGIYLIPGGPALQAVRPMDVARDGTLWLGTQNGVRAYHPNGSFDDYTTANSPLADNDVRTIRVDRLTGHVWIASAGGLNRFDPGYAPVAVQLPSLSIMVYPNPARLSAIGVPVRLSGNGGNYVGAIYDLSGRRLSRFAVGGNQRVVWDGRDAQGGLARPGIYFLRAESGGRSAVVRIVLLR